MSRSRDNKTEPSAETPDPSRLVGTILNSIADGVFTVDRDWNITSFNRAAEKITGVPREQALGRKCFDVFRANICAGGCAIRQAMATGQDVVNLRVDILNHQGQTVPISVSASVLRDERGRMVGGVETFRDLSAVEQLRRELTQSYSFQDIIGKSREMQRLFRILPDVAESESTVLLEGESGTGKELFARAIHDLSPRKDGPYVVVNCGALPDTLLESELFGYKKGAFTDAKKDKPGRFALAEGGTIFLDEVGTISPAVQVKLLRVLQEKEFEPLGATGPVKADVRVVAASNRPLIELVRDGKFRDDLFYRLQIVTLELPPLRERREDIPLLVDYFINQLNVAKDRDVAGLSPAAMQRLMEYDFPGNVRELQNILEHAFVLCRRGLIDVHHLPRYLQAAQEPDTGRAEPPRSPLAEAEAREIRAALERNNGHRGRTARELGIDPSTLWRKMKRLGIQA